MNGLLEELFSNCRTTRSNSKPGATQSAIAKCTRSRINWIAAITKTSLPRTSGASIVHSSKKRVGDETRRNVPSVVTHPGMPSLVDVDESSSTGGLGAGAGSQSWPW